MTQVDQKIGPDGGYESFESFNESLRAGPEVLGFYDEDIYDKLCEREVGYFIDGPNGRRPFCIPVGVSPDINQPFFANPANIDQELPAFHMFVPRIEGDVPPEMIDVVRELAELNATIFFQFEQSDGDTQASITRLFEEAGVDANEVPLIDSKNETEASVFHYLAQPVFNDPPLEVEEEFQGKHGQALQRHLVETEQVEAAPETGTTILLPEYLTEEMRKAIWQNYDTQMDLLIENHPRYQRLHEKELNDLLEADDSVNIVYFEDGNPVFVFIGVTDLAKHAPWLDGQQIKEDNAGVDILYCPAMFVDINRSGQKHSQKAFATLLDVIQMRGRNMGLYFECTNISATYVPKAGIEAIDGSGIAKADLKTVANYVQKAVSLS